MNSLNCEDEFVVFNMEHSRKRKRNEAEWKKNKPKQKRHSGEGKVAHKSCQHPIRSYCKHKRGIRLQSLQVEERPPVSQVKAVKKRDILQLLRAMGEMDVEATMNFYKSICGSHGSDNENNDDPNTQVQNEDTW